MKALILIAPLLISASPQEGRTFDGASGSLQEKLETATAELSALRDEIAAEMIPLTKELNDLESKLVGVRAEYQQTTRLLDSRTLDLANLKRQIDKHEKDATYVSTLLGDYIREFESRLHIAEVALYEDALEQAKLAPENKELSRVDIDRAQSELLGVSLARLEDALGGSRFDGAAVVASGLVKDGTFVMVGPSAIFQSADGQDVGSAVQRLGSLEPTQVAFADEEDVLAAGQLAASGTGFFPLDPTLGNAAKIEATEQETFLEHVEKGGLVMFPIFGMAACALLVALYKWLTLALTRKPSKRRIRALLDAIATGSQSAADEAAQKLHGPVGRMLRAGVQHLREPKELIEEVMYETVLTTRLKLQRMLPFIAICAASAPLLGLLGTVTGIISTFKLITVFGSGDVKSLSGGISEALITTKFGLIVAIPSLLLHAFLSRKVRGVLGQMESAAVALVNQVSLTPIQPEAAASSPAGGRPAETAIYGEEAPSLTAPSAPQEDRAPVAVD